MGTPSNLVVLHGTIAKAPDHRELAGGAIVVQFDVSTPVDDNGKITNNSVPVSFHDPSPSALAAVSVGEEVVVVGTVRRRFFRVGGTTQSRTEVIVDSLVPQRRRKTARSVVAAAVADLMG